jgi:hypothetical protein
MASSRPISRAVLRRRVRRLVLGHRRLLAALLTCVAVLAALQAVQPPGRDGAATPSRPEAAQSRGDALVAAHPGLTPIPVRFPDAAMAALLEPGDRVSLLATDGTGVIGGEAAGAAAPAARVVADDVEILQQVPDGTESSGIGGAAGRLVIVGVTAGSVASVAAAAVRSVLTYAWGR